MFASTAFVDMRFAATPTANLKILFFHKAVRPRGKGSLYLQMRLGGSCMKIIEYLTLVRCSSKSDRCHLSCTLIYSSVRAVFTIGGFLPYFRLSDMHCL